MMQPYSPSVRARIDRVDGRHVVIVTTPSGRQLWRSVHVSEPDAYRTLAMAAQKVLGPA
mgnify:CR=1 FL=1